MHIECINVLKLGRLEIGGHRLWDAMNEWDAIMHVPRYIQYTLRKPLKGSCMFSSCMAEKCTLLY